MNRVTATAVAMLCAHVPDVLRVRCHYCSKQKPACLTHQIRGAQRICDYCLEWHIKAMEFLAGGPMPGCQGCLATWEFLRDSTPEESCRHEHDETAHRAGVEVRLYVVPKDGIYQVLCETCVRPYVSKRVDLYAGTPFGTQTLKI